MFLTRVSGAFPTRALPVPDSPPSHSQHTPFLLPKTHHTRSQHASAQHIPVATHTTDIPLGQVGSWPWLRLCHFVVSPHRGWKNWRRCSTSPAALVGSSLPWGSCFQSSVWLNSTVSRRRSRRHGRKRTWLTQGSQGVACGETKTEGRNATDPWIPRPGDQNGPSHFGMVFQNVPDICLASPPSYTARINSISKETTQLESSKRPSAPPRGRGSPHHCHPHHPHHQNRRQACQKGLFALC